MDKTKRVVPNETVISSGHYMHWLGLLRLLGELAVKLDDEDRELIQVALDDAIAHGAPIKWHSILDHIEVEIDIYGETSVEIEP